MVITGLGLGWVELAVPGTALVGLFLVAWLAALGDLPYQVDCQVGCRRVAVGGQGQVNLKVRHLGSRRARPTTLRLSMGQRSRLVKVPWLAPGQSIELAVPLPTARRARLMVGPVQARLGDPFGLVGRTRQWGTAVPVTVYPQTIQAPTALAGLVKDLEGRVIGQSAAPNLTFHALRQYQTGDDQRAIHWLASARQGELMVRQCEDVRRHQLAVALSTAQEQYLAAADFELAVQAGASIGLTQIEQAGDVAVVAGGTSLVAQAACRGQILDQAASLVWRPAADGGQTLAAAAVKLCHDARGTTLAVLLAGAALQPPDWRQAAQHLPREAVVLGLCCQEGANPAATSVGPLTVATIGRLADLPWALRQLGRHD